MKKTFSLKDESKKPERMADSIKNEIKKYFARERRKKLPAGVDYWDFSCKIGLSEEESKEIHNTEISKSIDKLVEESAEAFYLEILSKQAVRNTMIKKEEFKKANPKKEYPKKKPSKYMKK